MRTKYVEKFVFVIINFVFCLSLRKLCCTFHVMARRREQKPAFHSKHPITGNLDTFVTRCFVLLWSKPQQWINFGNCFYLKKNFITLMTKAFCFEFLPSECSGRDKFWFNFYYWAIHTAALFPSHEKKPGLPTNSEKSFNTHTGKLYKFAPLPAYIYGFVG